MKEPEKSMAWRNVVMVIAVIMCMATLTIAFFQVNVVESKVNDNGLYTIELEQETVKSELFLHQKPPKTYLEPNMHKTKTVKVASGQMSVSWPDPPPHDEVAKTARYIMHISDWAAMATTSVHKNIEGFPFANVFSVSDGPLGTSTGIPYMYLTPMELSVHDLKEDNRASLTMSEAQSSYCHEKGFDPEDPRCAHVIFTGRIMKVENGTKEASFAKEALFSRHPEMPDWPVGHQFYFAKLNITHIYVLDFFGGAKVVDVDEYYKADPFA
ncbi:protein CREG1-like isoform X2 [Oratosquilla oratoria]|uniref:protein CREG1-like isoform X2 n=1 Tax=Oratosquilla oratoria TaxID=337810 RepID=UPI003F7578B2